ncbi:undecaprenyldiphospho-muramoylpentapeptide beta-N-acetylglucosaminyltransferase [Rubrobacter xylanophilus]|nr:undecaprenyldiphospho-muramoylpentapeptide beta-N-acetylglucosaminyltransferase [Rubrobacter xylanophilus]
MRVVIAGGGTGGHVIPALCVAEALRERGAEVVFFGSESGLERALVPEAGFELHALPLAGLAGGPVRRARALVLFARAVVRCRSLLGRLRPGAVLGVGGYASAPAVAAARSLGISTFIHEQNSVPGKVNRAAGRLVREVLVAFPDAARRFGRSVRAVHVGMPTRRQLFQATREEALRRLGLEPPVVLVFGGSGGALNINLAAAEAFGESTPYSVVQIAGRRDFPRLSTRNPRHRILEYAGNIWDYLAAADVVVIRGGAGSLFDVAAVGRAAIVVPYPHHRDDQQLLNARYFVERGAAELLPDREVDAKTLRARVEELLGDDEGRRALASSMRSLATPRAAEEVAGRMLAAGREGTG